MAKAGPQTKPHDFREVVMTYDGIEAQPGNPYAREGGYLIVTRGMVVEKKSPPEPGHQNNLAALYVWARVIGTPIAEGGWLPLAVLSTYEVVPVDGDDDVPVEEPPKEYLWESEATNDDEQLPDGVSGPHSRCPAEQWLGLSP